MPTHALNFFGIESLLAGKGNASMYSSRWFLAVSHSLVLLLLAVAALADGPTVVDGQNDSDVDRQAIQDAIDRADDDDAVVLRGTFQLDGERVFLRQEVQLRGVARDDDGDGRRNEDWADGVDNDGDGVIDEDDWNTVLRGLVDVNGQPLGDLADGTLFNRGISIEGLGDDVEDIEIRDIAFTGFHRAVSVLPDLRDRGSVFGCDDVVPTDGELEELRLRRNRFTNNTRAVQLFGAVEEAEIRGNVVVGGGVGQVLLVGGLVGCLGEGGPFEIGRPTETRVRGNHFQSVGAAAFLTSGTVDTLVSRNVFVGSTIAVALNDDVRADVVDNVITGSFFPIFPFRSTGPARISGNRLEDYFTGIRLDISSGYLIKDNVFNAPAAADDVFLDPESTNNRVLVPAGTVVTDLGIDNVVIIE